MSYGRQYTFLDFATQTYLAFAGLVVLYGHGHTAHSWILLLACHALAIGAIHLVIRLHEARPDLKFVGFIRHFYPVLLYGPLYCETGWLNQVFVSGFLDPTFIRLDGRLFGCQPSLVLMAHFPSPILSETFYAAYFSYYPMLSGIGLALFLRSREQFFHYLSVLSFVFYVCYAAYIFIPVVGPQIFFPELAHAALPAAVQPAVVPAFPAAVQAGPAFQLMQWIYEHFESPGAAFPSSHVAIALTTVFFSFQYLRRIRWLHLCVALLLCIATVYCRYHYLVDAIAGALAAAILIPLGSRLYLRSRSYNR